MQKYDAIVTGASGFIGQYLFEALSSRGLRVIGIDKQAPTIPIEIIRHDLSEPFLGDFEADTCIHLASAVGGILFNNSAKADLIGYNAAINTRVVELAKRAGCRQVVFFSSINIFESNPVFEHGPIRIPPNVTAYAQSKAGGEAVFQQSFENLVVIRPTNVYGRRQVRTHSKTGESHVIPDLLKKLEEGDVLRVLGDGTQRRNFIHVTDVVDFVCRSIGLTGHRYFNLRSDLTISIAQLAKDLAAFLGKRVQLEFDPSFMKLETFHIQNFDLSAPKALDWVPKINSIADGLSI